MTKKTYIVTSIPYANGKPHMGHTLDALYGDVLSRYYKVQGQDSALQVGIDENGQKVYQKAQSEGVSVEDWLRKIRPVFLDFEKRLGIDYQIYTQTSDRENHFPAAQEMWKRAQKKGDIYKKNYKGLYCVGCEVFYLEKDLVDGKCPEHYKEPEIVEEENYFFKLSNYQDRLLKLIESDEYKITPKTRKNEIVSFIKMGLEDFSISRSVERAHGWGVPVPGDTTQIMYVWFDALANYLTAVDYASGGEKFKKYWPADLHVIGKGITRFHAVYWPAMLLSAGMPLPKELFVHGYINVSGEKMSKSLGNVVDPLELVKKYGTDPVRYYLLKQIHPVEDSDFSYEQFEEVYNADLANGIGNLVSRTANMIEKSQLQVTCDVLRVASDELRVNQKVDQAVKEFKFNEALQEIKNQITAADQLIDQAKPWALVKSDIVKAEAVLSEVAGRIVNIAGQLKPFLPETAEKILKTFEAQNIVKPPESLFPRI